MTASDIIAIIALALVILFIAYYIITTSTKRQITYTSPPSSPPPSSPPSSPPPSSPPPSSPPPQTTITSTYVLVNGQVLTNSRPIITLQKVTSLVITIKDSPFSTFSIFESTFTGKYSTSVTTNSLGAVTKQYNLTLTENYTFMIFGKGITTSGISIIVINTTQTPTPPSPIPPSVSTYAVDYVLVNQISLTTAKQLANTLNSLKQISGYIIWRGQYDGHVSVIYPSISYYVQYNSTVKAAIDNALVTNVIVSTDIKEYGGCTTLLNQILQRGGIVYVKGGICSTLSLPPPQTTIVVNGKVINASNPYVTLMKVSNLAITINDGANKPFTIKEVVQFSPTKSVSLITTITTNASGVASRSLALNLSANYSFAINNYYQIFVYNTTF